MLFLVILLQELQERALSRGGMVYSIMKIKDSNNHSHNTEDLRADVEKKIKPVVATSLKEQKLLREGGRVPELTSPCDTSDNVNKANEVKNADNN